MKILIATDTYHPSVNGAAYFTYRLANSLVGRGHEVFVMCPSRSFSTTTSNEDGVRVYGIRSIHIPVYQNLRVSPLSISKRLIEKFVEEISPDIIHIQNHFMIGKGAMIAGKKLNIPIIGTNHFMPENMVHHLHLPKIAEKWLLRFGWWQCIKVFNKLDVVTTPTKTAADLLRKAGFNKKVLPLSCGLDLERFKSSNDGAYLKKRYGIPTDKSILLYVGRLDKEKKIDVILSALPEIIKNINVHLVLAGIGEERKNLEKIIEKLRLQTSVTFTGFIPDEDLQNIYKIADAFVIAGIAELQSIVTMEAIASGLPVVAVNAMALPELVHDGENGYVFPNGNSLELAKKAITILSDKKLSMEMSKKGLEIIKHHDIKKIIEKYELLYDETIVL